MHIRSNAIYQTAKKYYINHLSLLSVGGEQFAEETDSTFRYCNAPFEYPVSTIRDALKNLPTPFFDETGYKGRIDMSINTRLTDLPALRKELARYGLELREAPRELEMLVISPVSKN